MAGSVNKVTIVGKLGKDPESRTVGSGLKIVSFSVATSESWIDKASGERKSQTEWHRVVVMNERLGAVAEKYLTKGSSVYLEGKLQTRKWTDQAGNEKYTTEILLGKYAGELVLLERKAEGVPDAPTRATSRAPAGGGTGAFNPDDEIPFAASWQ